MWENIPVNWKIKAKNVISNITSLLVFMHIYTQIKARENKCMSNGGMVSDCVCFYFSIKFLNSLNEHVCLCFFLHFKNIYNVWSFLENLENLKRQQFKKLGTPTTKKFLINQI